MYKALEKRSVGRLRNIALSHSERALVRRWRRFCFSCGAGPGDLVPVEQKCLVTTVEVRQEGGDIIGVTRLSCSLLAAFAIYLFAALLAAAMAAGEDASLDGTDTALVAELRLLGIGNESVRLTATLSFVRDIGVSGVVSESLALSLAKAGVPALVFAEARQALATIIDFDRDVGSGNRFYVRYRQGFSVEGAGIGAPLLLWAELRTTGKGTITVHRFRPNGGPDRLWLANGGAAEPPSMRLPLDVINLSIGLRPPCRSASTSRTALQAPAGPRTRRYRWVAPAGTGGSTSDNPARRLPVRAGEELTEALRDRVEPQRRARHRPCSRTKASTSQRRYGTPVYAAADEHVVTGAGPNGGYGNSRCKSVPSEQRLRTVYGHPLGVRAGTLHLAHVSARRRSRSASSATPAARRGCSSTF